MTNRTSPALPRDLKTKIETLISFQDGKKLVWRAADESRQNLRLPSKYRRVLTCSFTDRAERTASAERTVAERR